jgi:hypothetical protein
MDPMGIRSHNLFRIEIQAGNSNHQLRAMVGQMRSYGDAVLETPSPRQNVLRSKVRKGFSVKDTDEEKGQLRDAIRAVLGGHTFTDNDGEVWGWDRVSVNASVGKVRLFPAWPCAIILKLACWCPDTLITLSACWW